MTAPVTLLGDFHVHSTFSDDAESTLAENIAAAAAAGLTELRLIDHVRASTTWVPEFVAAVAAEPVPDGLTVLTGVEAKLLNTAGDLDVPFDLGGIQAIVIADHQFPGDEGPLSPETVRARLADGWSRAEAIDMFLLASSEAMLRFAASYPGLGSQLAHWFSILPKAGLSEDDISDEQFATWASVAAATGTIIEVNEKWACPGPRAVRAALAAGARVVASTDSHVASDVGRYERVAAILGEAGA